jgi:NAD(P)-dependent dehydrogenase (short-subunit alcohol dehydrogenase family)
MTEPDHTILMTGGSSGLGRIAATVLLREQSTRHLLLAVRGGKAQRVAGELATETGNPRVSAIDCDLASLADIRHAAAEVGARLDSGDLPPLRGFLGNAGVQMPTATRTTADGFETTFAVNVLANYLLLRLLMSRLAAPSRIVVTGSDVHFADFRHNLGLVPSPRWTATAEVAAAGTGPSASSVREGQRSYVTSKLGVIYLVHALARRLPAGIDAYTYNPGGVPGTGLAREAGETMRAVGQALMWALRITPFATGIDKAGQLLAAAMAGPRPAESGAYIDRGKPIPSSPESYDRDREEELWAAAAQLCGLDAAF